MMINFRVVEMDGTEEGQTLYMAEDVDKIVVPQEYARMRFGNHPGMYEVIEQGVTYFFWNPEFYAISVFVVRVDEAEEQHNGKEA